MRRHMSQRPKQLKLWQTSFTTTSFYASDIPCVFIMTREQNSKINYLQASRKFAGFAIPAQPLTTPKATGRSNASIRPCYPCYVPCRKKKSPTGKIRLMRLLTHIIARDIPLSGFHPFNYFSGDYHDCRLT